MKKLRNYFNIKNPLYNYKSSLFQLKLLGITKSHMNTSNVNSNSEVKSNKDFNNQNIKSCFSEDLTTSNFHGHLRKDVLNLLQTSEVDKARIIKRESEYYKKWLKFIDIKSREWQIEVRNVVEKFESKLETNNENQGEIIGNYTYYNKNINGREVLFRKSNVQSSSKEELIFDTTKVPFIKNIKLASLKTMRVSDDGNLIAFIVDIDNNETSIGGIYNISEKTFFDKSFHNVNLIEFGYEQGSLIVVYNDNNIRPCHLYEYDLKTKKECKIISANDSSELIEVTKSNSGKLFVNLVSKTHSSIYIYDYALRKVNLLLPKIPNVKYFVEYSKKGYYYILSNLNLNKAIGYISSSESDNIKQSLFVDDYEQYKVYCIDENSTKLAKTSLDIIDKLRLLIIPSKSQFFEQIELYGDYLIVYGKNLIKPEIIVYNIKENKETEFSVFNQLGEITPGLNNVREFFIYFLDFNR